MLKEPHMEFFCSFLCLFFNCYVNVVIKKGGNLLPRLLDNFLVCVIYYCTFGSFNILEKLVKKIGLCPPPPKLTNERPGKELMLC